MITLIMHLLHFIYGASWSDDLVALRSGCVSDPRELEAGCKSNAMNEDDRTHLVEALWGHRKGKKEEVRL
jgi:hypothetical protein